jgi:diguanylate cyclase (GGDEF)-like protein
VERTPTTGELRRQLSRFVASKLGRPLADRAQQLERRASEHEDHQRRLELVWVPILRLVGFSFIAVVVVPLHNLLVEGGPPTVWVPASLGLLAYPVVSWLWVLAFAERQGRFDVGRVLLVLDLVVGVVAIYVTGAESSWIFFLPLLRVADQIAAGFPRSLFFAHAAPLTYLAVLATRVWVDGVALSWRTEIAKLAFLYVLGLYLSLTSLVAESRQRGITVALREARGAIRDLERESRRLVLSREELKDQVIRDPLTGLLNRKGILDIVERGLERAHSGEVPFSVVLADLDSFKEVNDTHGHGVGDVVLRWVATRMLASGRAFDAVGRIGGDEFLIALPNCDRSGANKLAERIRRAVAEDMVAAELSTPLRVEVSLGVATSAADAGVGAEQLLAAADAALYRAKQQGGNRVQLAPVRRSGVE